MAPLHVTLHMRSGGKCMDKKKGCDCRMELIGNQTLIMEGCEGVADYDSEEIILKAGRQNIRIRGKRLTLKVLTEDTAILEGVVTSIEYI